MKVTLQQLAWYLERDGWVLARTWDRGADHEPAREFRSPDWRMSVKVEPAEMDELWALREKVAARLHAKGAK